MKKFWLLFAGAFALLTLAACNDKEESDEESYAAQAIIISADPAFNTTSTGGAISFATEGGSVAVSVSCGCSWTADNDSPTLFSTGTTSNTLTVTAEQNTLEMQLTGTVTLKTAKQGIVFATIKVTQAAYGAPTLSLETNEWNAPAVGELTTEIAVTASYSWTAESADSWITVEKTDTGIALTAEENTGDEGRDTKVIVSCNDGVRDVSETVNVTQDPKAFLSLSQTSLSFDCNGGTATVTVDSNWDYTYANTASWLTLSLSGNVMTVTVSANEKSYDDREATVTITAGDGAANVATVQLTVAQEYDPKSLIILTYTITDELVNTSVPLPITNGTNVTVDWGDGSTTQGSLSNPTHTYSQAGEYEVTVRGRVTGLSLYGLDSLDDPMTAVTAVNQWGNTGLTDMKWAFNYCPKLEHIADPDGAFANVENFYFAFYECSSLKEIPAGFFDNCTKLTGVYMAFCGCESLTELPKEGIFHNCPKIDNLTGLFQHCHNIKEIPAGFFDGCSSATNLHQLFYGCSSLETIPAGLFDNLTLVEDIAYGFYGCSSLKEIPEGLFDSFTLYPAKAYGGYASTFEGCSSLTKVPTSLFSTNPLITNFYDCFYGCTNLEGESPYDVIEVDGEQVKVHLYERSNYVDIYSAVTSPQRCFTGCTKLDDYSSIPTLWKY